MGYAVRAAHADSLGDTRMLIDGLELVLQPTDSVEWLVADVSLSRAFFEGVPAARLLARTRLASDEKDLARAPLGATPLMSTWDALLKRLLAKSPAAEDRAKRHVARQTRAASDEGPLDADASTVAALMCALAASQDMDASLAEILASPGALDGATPGPEPVTLDAAVARASGSYDARLARARVTADLRAPLFEACVGLAVRSALGPIPLARVVAADRSLRASEVGIALLRPSNVSLYPRDFELEVRGGDDRRMARLERAELDVLLTRDPRELAAIVARVEERTTPRRASEDHGGARGLDTLLADLGKLLAHPGDLLLSVSLGAPLQEEEMAAGGPASVPSWLPTAWSSQVAGEDLAAAFERGAMTLPRLRAAVARGGDAALDAVGAEMLKAAEHPFASAAFAELLARSGRARDVVRLVTYFAVAPDPALAARALASSPAPELPTVLRAWLEAMLPTDGAPAQLGEDPQTSSGARLTACVSSLAPYPHLYRAVRPLLARISDAPPPPASS